jgi:hypothetical protein
MGKLFLSIGGQPQQFELAEGEPESRQVKVSAQDDEGNEISFILSDRGYTIIRPTVQGVMYEPATLTISELAGVLATYSQPLVPSRD